MSNSNSHVFLNGEIVPAKDARISILDAGLQHGVGLFETFFIYNGKPWQLTAHLRRLQDSANECGLQAPLDLAVLENCVQQLIDIDQLTYARMRLTLTAGALSMLPNAEGKEVKIEPTLLIQHSPPSLFPKQAFSDGIPTRIHGSVANPLNPFSGHKTLNYWPRLAALRQAGSAGMGEAIMFSITNHLASGCVSNIFLVKNNKLLTPIARGEEIKGALASPVLPGITRNTIVKIAKELGIETEKRMLTVDDLMEAEQAFLTNSNWLMLPIKSVEKHTYENPSNGIYKTIKEVLSDQIANDCGEAPLFWQK